MISEFFAWLYENEGIIPIPNKIIPIIIGMIKYVNSKVCVFCKNAKTNTVAIINTHPIAHGLNFILPAVEAFVFGNLCFGNLWYRILSLGSRKSVSDRNFFSIFFSPSIKCSHL